MIIDCICDLHGFYPELEGGDLLIVAGDLTARNAPEEYFDFEEWFDVQPYKKKILIGGNHDNFLVQNGNHMFTSQFISYLEDSGTEFEGLKIWGSPHSLWFDGVNPKCTAFMGSEKDLQKKYEMIPDDIDILITHTPPFGILDKNISGKNCGSRSLLEAIIRIRPRIVVFGHIHEQGYKLLEIAL